MSALASGDEVSRRSRAKVYPRSPSGENRLTKVVPTQSRSSALASVMAATASSKSQLWTRRTRSWMSEPTFSGWLLCERWGIATALRAISEDVVAIGAFVLATAASSSTTTSSTELAGG